MSEFRRLRHRMGLTQAELAGVLEVSLSTVQRWERRPDKVALLALFAVFQHWSRERGE